MERSRCWNLAVAAAIDCSILIGSKKDRWVLIGCFCGKPKRGRDTNLQKKVYCKNLIDAHPDTEGDEAAELARLISRFGIGSIRRYRSVLGVVPLPGNRKPK